MNGRPWSLASDRPSSERLAFALFCSAAGAYLLHAIFALASARHLYGDASWFLLRVASEGRATSFVDDFLHQFHYSRALSFWISQGPTVLALHLGLRDLGALSYLFGATLFGVKLISLIVCYRLLPPGQKIFFVFPALGLFAGTINSDVYIVSETHLAVALAWPILIALHRGLRGSLETVICGLCIAVTTLIHESYGFFAALMLTFLTLRWWRDGRPRDPRLFVLVALLAVVMLVNLAGIAFPRDPTNRESFGHGLILLLHPTDGMRGIHIGPLVSVVASVAVVAVAFLPRRAGFPGSGAVLAVICLSLAAAPVAHFAVFFDSVLLSGAINDRGFSGFAMQMLLMSAFLLVHVARREMFQVRAAAAAALLASLVLGQTAWQLLATRLWRGAIGDMRSRMAAGAGLLVCPSGAGRLVPAARLRADRTLCNWSITPLSIVLSPGARVRSILVARDYPFEAFDAGDVEALPSLQFVRHDYAPYVASLLAARQLGPGQKVLFGDGGRGVSMIRQGFSASEHWGTWTNGERARLEVCGLAVRPEDSVHLVFRVTPFVPPRDVEVLAAGERLETWRFTPGDRIVEREVRLAGAAIPSSGCLDLSFRIPNPRSPLALGLSTDPRLLGLGFFDLQRGELQRGER